MVRALPAIRCLPSGEQELLLKAALLPIGAGLAAWRAWRARNTFDHVDRGSLRLLALVHCNLGRNPAGADALGDDAAQLRHIHRGAW